jgi:hypothetical protein
MDCCIRDNYSDWFGMYGKKMKRKTKLGHYPFFGGIDGAVCGLLLL